MTSTDPKTGGDLNAAADRGMPPDAELLRMAQAADARVQAAAAGAAPGSAAGPGASSPGGSAPALPLEREIAGMFAVIGEIAGRFLPSVKVVLEEQICLELGSSLAPLVRKYGLDRHIAGFAWREELRAAMVVVPVAIALRQAVKHDLAQYAAADAAAQASPAAAAAPGSATPAATAGDVANLRLVVPPEAAP